LQCHNDHNYPSSMSGNKNAKRTVADIADQAFVVRVTELIPIEGRNDIELASIKGWKCIVTRGTFKVGALAVYIAMGYKVKGISPAKTDVIAMGGIMSQGALVPLQCLASKGFTDLSKFEENDSVTAELDVVKHIPFSEREQYKKKSTRQEFPEYVPKTESIRLQNDPDLFFTAIADKNVVITRKEDGMSSTYIYNDGKFRVCSRNFVLNIKDVQELPDYFEMEDKYDIKRGLTKLKRNIAIQGEIVGPRINGNRLNLQDKFLYVFDVYDIDAQAYMGYHAMLEVCAALGLPTVPLLYRGPASGALPSLTQENFMALAEAQEYGPGLPAEGIVVKSDDPMWRQRRVHFKLISDVYAKKYNVY